VLRELMQSSMGLFSGIWSGQPPPADAVTGPDAVLESPLTRKLSAFVALSEADLATLARFYQRRRGSSPATR
jgi:hypothetical protein